MSQTEPYFVATEQDITIFRNEDPWRKTFLVMHKWGYYGQISADATLKMQLRLYEGAPDPPLLTLTATGASKITSAAHKIFVAIARSDLATLPFYATDDEPDLEPGQPMRLRYDIMVTTPNFGDNVVFYGAVQLRNGVTPLILAGRGIEPICSIVTDGCRFTSSSRL